ncbi:hypothetical protein EASAB2608_08307 [Streptomyces sp. EAS-AB2608]|nr:hypothetical protein EASAB2608_08307 [Streptomyces sp. EAS-AB2608]
MKFVDKMPANLTDPTPPHPTSPHLTSPHLTCGGGDAMDRVVNGLSKVAPKA